MCSGLLIASNTRCRGASNTRVMRISRSPGVVTSKVSLFAALLTAMSLLLCFQFLQIDFEAVQTAFPERPIALRPVSDLLERSRFQTARPPLRVAAAGDQPRPFEHAQVLRDGRHAHLEGLRQFGDRALARCQPGENRAPCGVGKGRECSAELVWCHGVLNQSVTE